MLGCINKEFKTDTEKEIMPLRASRNRLPISILSFAGDCFLLIRADIKSYSINNYLLTKYSEASEAVIN